MSDLRRLIARMDQLNEINLHNPDALTDPRGLSRPPEAGGGGAGGAAPSVKAGPMGTTIYTSPAPKITASPRLNVDTNVAEIPAYIRRGKSEPITTPKPGSKPSVTVKPGETMDQALQRTQTEKEFGQFLKGQGGQTFDPSAAGAGRGTVNPPAVIRKRGDPNFDPTLSKTAPAPKSTSSTVTNEPIDPVMSARPGEPSIAPTTSTTAPVTQKTDTSSWKNFRKDAPVQPDPSKFSSEKSPEYVRAKDEYKQSISNPTSYYAPGIAAAAGLTAASKMKNNKKDADTATDPAVNNQQPATDADKEPTKESLQNKLFKEFKTFVEKR